MKLTSTQMFESILYMYKKLRPGPKTAPLMCRTKLNKVRLLSDFGATADSDGVLTSNLIQEVRGLQFSMKKYAFSVQELCPNGKAVTNISLSKQYSAKQIQSQGSLFVFRQVLSR